jgi:hypothetical protein
MSPGSGLARSSSFTSLRRSSTVLNGDTCSVWQNIQADEPAGWAQCAAK